MEQDVGVEKSKMAGLEVSGSRERGCAHRSICKTLARGLRDGTEWLADHHSFLLPPKRVRPGEELCLWPCQPGGLGASLVCCTWQHLRGVWEWVTSRGRWVAPGPSGFVEATAPVFPRHQLVGHAGGGGRGRERRSSCWKDLAWREDAPLVSMEGPVPPPAHC